MTTQEDTQSAETEERVDEDAADQSEADAAEDAGETEVSQQSAVADIMQSPQLQGIVDKAVAKATQKAAAEFAQSVEQAQQTAANARSLLPINFSPVGKTARDILLQAVGDVVPDAGKRSDEYLQGCVDTMVKHRMQPTVQSTAGPAGDGKSPVRFEQIKRS